KDTSPPQMCQLVVADTLHRRPVDTSLQFRRAALLWHTFLLHLAIGMDLAGGRDHLACLSPRLARGRRRMSELQPVTIAVFLVLFIGVSALGFVATRWKKGDLHQLDEWGLGGRKFGPLLVWFLLGGDLYTAYTFVALPALMF